MQFYIAGAVADRGIGPADYQAERIDTIGGAIFADLISMFIIIATAAAIHVRAPLESAAAGRARAEPVAGRFADQLFAFGLLGASALAAAVVPLSTAYAISEAAGAERSVARRFREAPLFLGLFTGQIILGASVALIPGNLIQLLINAQLLNGIITPILLTYVLILANRKRCSATLPTAPSIVSSPPSAWSWWRSWRPPRSPLPSSAGSGSTKEECAWKCGWPPPNPP